MRRVYFICVGRRKKRANKQLENVFGKREEKKFPAKNVQIFNLDSRIPRYNIICILQYIVGHA